MRSAIVCVAIVASMVVAASADGATKTWTGVNDGLWSDGTNWAGGIPPTAGDDLVFQSASRLSVHNDISGVLPLRSLTFNGPGFDLHGNGITLSNGLTAPCCRAGIGIYLPITLSAPQTFAVTDGDLDIGAAMNLNGSSLTLKVGQFLGFGSTIDLSGSSLSMTANTTFFDVGSSIDGQGSVTSTTIYQTIVQTTFAFVGTMDVFGGFTMGYLARFVNAHLILHDSETTASGSFARLSLQDVALTLGPDFSLFPFGSFGPYFMQTEDLSITRGSVSMTVFTDPASRRDLPDQFLTKGTVTLSNPELRLRPSRVVVGTAYVIIDNDGTDPVQGTFRDLPEGSIFEYQNPYARGTTFRISYRGGTGNDVVLTVLGTPELAAIPTLNQSMLILLGAVIAFVAMRTITT